MNLITIVNENKRSNQNENLITPLFDNLSSSYVDKDKLIFVPDRLDINTIGMANFKSKPFISPKSPKGQNNNTEKTRNMIKLKWQKAATKIKLMRDPWYEFHLEEYPIEKVIRHRYNPVKKEWRKDECVVRIENKQFANGAMRACFRLKKLSNFSHHKSWEHASNYVAKQYKSEEIPRERYFEDVKLQMDAKLWAELYNRHNPPKKIDIFQMSIIEFVERLGSPLFHLEHYIEGKYIKYNSNAGFVEDSQIRNTPNAFSHFTFECSNHELIVVDIQGVGDLYTDPQIHTVKGNDYGDGNLGVKGFALFFYSHICNDICKSLGLTQFDLAPSEIKRQDKIISKIKDLPSITMARKKSKYESNFNTNLSARTRYLLNRISSSDDNECCEIEESEGYSSASPSYSPGIQIVPNCCFSNNFSSSYSNLYCINNLSRSFNSNYSNNTSFVDSPFENEDAYRFLYSNAFNKPRASGVIEEKNAILNSDTEFRHRDVLGFYTFESILGKVHLEMCKYHELERFICNENEKIDYEAAFFHLIQAANLGVTDALVNCAKIYMQMPHDILPEYKIENNDTNYDIGFEYMIEAAEKGEKSSLYFIAKAYDTGFGLGKNREIDWNKAIEYYRKLLSENHEEKIEDLGFIDIGTDCDPPYIILARIGEMYMDSKYGVEKNLREAAELLSEAAEKATQCGKGRLASKYYSLAERVSTFQDD